MLNAKALLSLATLAALMVGLPVTSVQADPRDSGSASTSSDGTSVSGSGSVDGTAISGSVSTSSEGTSVSGSASNSSGSVSGGVSGSVIPPPTPQDKAGKIADGYMGEKGVDPSSAAGQVVKPYVVGTSIVDQQWSTFPSYRYQYDARDNRTRIIDASGGTMRYEYDSAGRLIQSVDPAGHTTTFRYEPNPQGMRIFATDPAGQTSRLEYDVVGHITRVVDAAGGSTRFGYDDAGRIIEVTNPDGSTTRTPYDAAGRLVQVTNPDGGTLPPTGGTTGPGPIHVDTQPPMIGEPSSRPEPFTPSSALNPGVDESVSVYGPGGDSGAAPTQQNPTMDQRLQGAIDALQQGGSPADYEGAIDQGMEILYGGLRVLPGADTGTVPAPPPGPQQGGNANPNPPPAGQGDMGSRLDRVIQILQNPPPPDATQGALDEGTEILYGGLVPLPSPNDTRPAPLRGGRSSAEELQKSIEEIYEFPVEKGMHTYRAEMLDLPQRQALEFSAERDYAGAKYDAKGNQLGEIVYTDPEGRTSRQSYANAKYDSHGNQIGVVQFVDPEGKVSEQDYAGAKYDAKGNQLKEPPPQEQKGYRPREFDQEAGREPDRSGAGTIPIEMIRMDLTGASPQLGPVRTSGPIQNFTHRSAGLVNVPGQAGWPMPYDVPLRGAGEDGGKGTDAAGGAGGTTPGAAAQGYVTSRQVKELRELANRPGATQEDVRKWAMAKAQLTGRDPDDILREYDRERAVQNPQPNVLWGDYYYVEPGMNAPQGETSVPPEAGSPSSPAPITIPNGSRDLQADLFFGMGLNVLPPTAGEAAQGATGGAADGAGTGNLDPQLDTGGALSGSVSSPSGPALSPVSSPSGPDLTALHTDFHNTQDSQLTAFQAQQVSDLDNFLASGSGAIAGLPAFQAQQATDLANFQAHQDDDHTDFHTQNGIP